jgi:hypothetical protein
MRKFIYGLKLRDGRYLHGEGTSWEEAARSIDVNPSDVKRAISVKAVLSVAEIAKRDERIAKLKTSKAAEQSEDEGGTQ